MNPLGTSTQIETVSGATLSNSFSTMPTNDINSIIASNSVKSTQVGSGINSSAQQIRNSDGSYMVVGINSETNEMGSFFYGPNGKLVSKQTGSSYVTYDSNGVGLAQLGKFPDGSVALKVAKSNIEVSTATDDALIFNSNQDIFKIIRSGTASVTVGSGDSGQTKTVSIAHGLPFTPIVQAFVTTFGDLGPAGQVQCPFAQFEIFNTGTHPTLQLDVIQYCYANADSTNIYFNILSQDVTFFTQCQGTFSFKYYLLQETAK